MSTMQRSIFNLVAAVLCLLAVPITSICYDPVPAFPPPQWGQYTVPFDYDVFDILWEKLKPIFAKPEYDTSSASIEVTSHDEFQFSFYHTARVKNESRPGVPYSNGESYYRIASITKAFTTLAILQLHAAGDLDINDPVSKYIPELADDDSGELPWDEITLCAMASQLSGIPREFGQSDLSNEFEQPWKYGLPPASQEKLPPCLRKNRDKPCSTDELLKTVKTFKPLFAPNQKSTYSNLNFELLGVVIENVSGLKYEDYVRKKILLPLDMTHTTFDTPPEDHSVIPDGENWFGIDLGALNPTGGLYSTGKDLSKFLRYVLTHYNALVEGVDWFKPASFSGGMNAAYGMPWEIFRTDKMLVHNQRPVTFVTKNGVLPGYFSIIMALPEYNLGINILVAGNIDLLSELRELITTDTVQACENAIWNAMKPRYAGTYTATDLNTSIAISTSLEHGMKLDSFVSNDTDVFPFFEPGLFWQNIGKRSWHMQLLPTLLYKDEKEQQGEIYRLVFVPERSKDIPDRIWDDFCITDVDVPGTYAGLPSNEVVFWHERQEVELPAWRVTLKREKRHPQHITNEQQPLA